MFEKQRKSVVSGNAQARTQFVASSLFHIFSRAPFTEVYVRRIRGFDYRISFDF